ncbi:MAG: YcaO-like family protein [Desertimonas sp.]
MIDLGPDALVDPTTGIITWVRPMAPDPAAPPGLHLWASHTADVHRLFGWPADRYGTGMSFQSATRARGAAIGEAIERYCGNHIAEGLVVASAADLRAGGRRTIPLERLALYSEAQYRDPTFPFVPLSDDLVVAWTAGRELGDGSTRWVPASLVWVNYFLPPRDVEPPTNFAVFAGIAAGRSLEEACGAALEELIERDATMVWWHSGGDPLGVDLDDRRLAARLAPPPGSPVEMHYVSIPNRSGVPVIGALLHDTVSSYLTFGVAARLDPNEAVAKAAAEAWSLRAYAAGLAETDGMIWQAADADLIDGTPLKPHRADRRYADSYRADFRDVTDLACQAQIYLDPRMHRHAERIRRPARRVALSELARWDGRPADRYRRCLEDVGVDPVVVELTTPDVAACGLHVVRVVAPGLYSNPPAAFPFLGGSRLLDEPRTLGLTARTLDEHELVLTPLPHT